MRIHAIVTLLLSYHAPLLSGYSLFFFNDTATTEIYTLSLHDALPISAFLLNRESVKNDKPTISMSLSHCIHQTLNSKASTRFHSGDRKSGSAGMPRPISYAVFCLKKKKRQWEIVYDTWAIHLVDANSCHRHPSSLLSCTSSLWLLTFFF